MSYFSGGELYSGTVSDFSGSDPLILKQEIRTDRYDAKQLNSKYKHTPLSDSLTHCTDVKRVSCYYDYEFDTMNVFYLGT